MKKLISTILALSMIMTMCIPAFATSKVFGDVNDDGKITAVDARIILQVVAGSKEETDFIKSNGDLNDDGKISAVDARVVLQVVAGIIPAPERPSEPEVPEKTTYGAGETWIVPGQWEITINSARIHNLCNSVANEKYGYTNQQVVLVEYTYKNLGIEDGLYLSGGFIDYYDGELESAERYACTHTKSPKECIVGAKCTASDAIILENYSNKITIQIEKYDSNSIKQKAIFEIPIEGIGGNDNNDNNDDSNNNNSTTLRADEKLKDYVITNGKELTDKPGAYGVLKRINGHNTFIYYYSNEDLFRFVCNIELDDGETLVFMNYKYGANTQEVMTSSTFYSSSHEIITAGYIYTSSYTKNNGRVYLTACNISSEENAKSITESATAILMMQTEMMLSYTNTGVTLNSLGFSAW